MADHMVGGVQHFMQLVTACVAIADQRLVALDAGVFAGLQEYTGRLADTLGVLLIIVKLYDSLAVLVDEEVQAALFVVQHVEDVEVAVAPSGSVASVAGYAGQAGKPDNALRSCGDAGHGRFPPHRERCKPRPKIPLVRESLLS